MPPQMRPHDPFNDAPRRPRSQATNHLQETHSSSSHTLRTATTASRNLFAASLSRRPTTTVSNTHVNEVLEDSDDGGDRISRRTAATARMNRARRARAATETTLDEDDEDEEGGGDLVIRDERGGYLREVPAIGEQVVGAEEEQREEDARLMTIARDFWVSGAGTGGRGSRRLDEDELDKPKADMMARLREAVSKKLVDDQWMHGPTDYMEDLRIANHGRV